MNSYKAVKNIKSESHVSIDVYSEEGNGIIEISDNGSGFNKEIILGALQGKSFFSYGTGLGFHTSLQTIHAYNGFAIIKTTYEINGERQTYSLDTRKISEKNQLSVERLKPENIDEIIETCDAEDSTGTSIKLYLPQIPESMTWDEYMAQLQLQESSVTSHDKLNIKENYTIHADVDREELARYLKEKGFTVKFDGKSSKDCYVTCTKGDIMIRMIKENRSEYCELIRFHDNINQLGELTQAVTDVCKYIQDKCIPALIDPKLVTGFEESNEIRFNRVVYHNPTQEI